MSKPWQIWLVLIAIFATGAVSGGLVAFRIARKNLPRPPLPEVWGARQFEHFAKVLSLTPPQRQVIEPLMKKNIEELARLRRQAFRTSEDIFERMDADIAAQLTPEQRTRFEKIVKERREERRQLHDRGGRGGHEPPPPGGSPGGPPPPAPDATPKPTGT
jgi:Spy/CpxP family protein refolding chaperone